MRKALGRWLEQRNICNLRIKIESEVRCIGEPVTATDESHYPEILDAGSGKLGSWDYTKGVTKADLCYGNDFNKPLVFMDNEFDLIVCSGVIQYLENLELFITELKRILKPDGRIILATINNDCWLRRIGLVKRALKKDEWQLFTEQSLEIFINKFGFKKEHSWGIDFVPLFPTGLCTNIGVILTNDRNNTV